MGTMEINEFNQEKLRLLDTEQLLAFYGIFGRVSSPKAEEMVTGITRELKRRNYTLGEENLNEVDVKALMKGLVKGTTIAGKGLAKAIKVGYPIAKDMVKATWMASKKIGGALGDLMDDPEFRKMFTKYVDNPEDPNRLKKLQSYTNSALSDSPVSGFESVQVKESRLKKVCSIVLGKDFDHDFIYEDVDFTKPSSIKDAYKSFALKETVNENRAIVYNPKGIKRFIKQAEKKFPQYKGEIEQLEDDEIIFPNDPKLINFFKGAREVKFVLNDSVDHRKLKISNKLSSAEYEKFSKYKAFNSKDWKWNSKEGLYHRVTEETELEEASASDIKKVLAAAKKAGGDVKGNQIDFGMGAVIDVSVEKGKIKLDGGKSSGVEYFNNVKDAVMAFESVELEEAFMRLPGNIINNELYVAKMALGEFLSSQMAGNDFDAKRLNTIIKSLNDVKKSAKKFNKPEEVPLSFQYKKESTDLEESISVKALTTAAAIRLKKKLDNKWSSYDFNIDKTGLRLSVPNEKAVIRYIKKQPEVDTLEESVDLEEAINWWTVTITKKAGKLFKGQTVDVKASNSAQAIKKGIKQMKGDPTTVPSGSVDAVLGESLEEAKSDTQKDIESLKAMIKNPDPKRVKSYGGTKYVDMLKSKLAKLEESTDLETTNTLTQDEYDEVQNFRNFKERDWKYDKKTKTYIRKNKV